MKNSVMSSSEKLRVSSSSPMFLFRPSSSSNKYDKKQKVIKLRLKKKKGRNQSFPFFYEIGFSDSYFSCEGLDLNLCVREESDLEEFLD